MKEIDHKYWFRKAEELAHSTVNQCYHPENRGSAEARLMWIRTFRSEYISRVFETDPGED